MNKYVKGGSTKTKHTDSLPKQTTGPHEIPILGDFNTISGGFAGGGPTRSARKRYARNIMMAAISEPSSPTPDIVFSSIDSEGIIPHEDDPVVLSVIMMGRNVHRVLIDQGSSANVMFWEAFVGLQVPRDQLLPFDGVLVGFSGEQVEVRGYVNLRTTFADEHAAKTIVIKYIVVKAPSSYNMLLGRPSLNKLGAVVSTVHLKMKFPAEGKVVTMKVDQEIARKCYEKSLRIRRDTYNITQVPNSVSQPESELDPRPPTDQGPQPIGELKEIEIIPEKKIKIGADLDPTTEAAIRRVLRTNIASFAWSARDMPGIDPDILCHRLNINPQSKPRIQRRRRLNEEKSRAATAEIKKLTEAGHIKEIQYPEWLANIVMVKKANGKWRMCVDFTDLNLACPKDSYPIPNRDILVDRVSGCGLLSFMDAYSGYNQIRMHPADEDKTAFMGTKSNFCYKVMPFGLKNAGATYQRMMDRILQPLLGKNVESYVDDMVVTSTGNESHATDMQEIFSTINKYQLKLNPEKCVFGVKAGKFLGFMLTERGIEANPDKCQAIINMKSPSCVKEVQQLTGRMAALSRFLAKSGDKGHPYFQCLKKNEKFQWTPECEDSFLQLKSYLSRPPVLSRPEKGHPLQLYVTVTEHAISSVLVQEREERRYPILEKAALAVVISARKLRPYFQSFSIQVRTDLPVKQILKRPDMTGRLVKWAIKLAEYDINYEPRGAIKAQALADFVAELTLPASSTSETTPTDVNKSSPEWVLSVDGASNQKGSGAGVILEGPGGVLIEQSLKFSFKASNNQAEYEALIAGMLLAKEIGASRLAARSDSLLVTGQVNGEFTAKDPQLAKYLDYVRLLAKAFETFHLTHVPRQHNSRADLLSKLASCTKPGQHKSVIKETLTSPRVDSSNESRIMNLDRVPPSESWINPIRSYIADGVLPTNEDEAQRIKRSSSRYTLVDGHLFRFGFSRPILTCVEIKESRRIMAELHEGICGSHIGGRALLLRVLRAGYFWPTMRTDCMEHVKRCDQCQRQGDYHRAPPEILHSIHPPWPFHTWGIDILGPFPIAARQLKYLVVAVEYLTKWIEAEPVANITASKVEKFIWKNLVCRFGVPRRLISDNGTQFTSSQVRQTCRRLGITQCFSSIEHPQTNGQAEAANRVILRALKRRVLASRSSWPEEISRILWAYHTTPQSTTHETPFSLVYGTDALLPIEVGHPTENRKELTTESNEEGVRANLDVLEEIRELARITGEATKRRVERRYRTKVIPRDFKINGLVLRRAHLTEAEHKLSPKWVGPFRIREVLPGGAYRMETLDGSVIPRTWNAANLRFYFS